MTKSIHVVADGKISFFFMAEWCSVAPLFMDSGLCLFLCLGTNKLLTYLGCCNNGLFFFKLTMFRKISMFSCLFLGLISNIFLSFSVINCTASQFTCVSNGQCISKIYHCDGIFDCDDHSDETNCRKYHIPSMFQVTGSFLNYQDCSYHRFSLR